MDSNTQKSANKEEDIAKIRNTEYLLQLKSQVKFPIFEKLKKLAKLADNEEFKHHTKIKITKDKEEPIFAIIFVFTNKIILAKESIEKYELNEPSSSHSNNTSTIGQSTPSSEKSTGTITASPNHNAQQAIQNPIISVIPFDHFCAFKLNVNETDPNEMYIQYYDQAFSSKSDIRFNFIFLKDSYCVHHFIKKYYILSWQKLFEDQVLRDYELLIYNRHFVLIKANSWGKKQERLLLITNKLLFNMAHNLAKDQLVFNIKKVKWADAIRGMTKIVITSSKENELKIYQDKIINHADNIQYLRATKWMKYKEKRDFEFYSNVERNEFLAIIRKNYWDITGRYLDVETGAPKPTSSIAKSIETITTSTTTITNTTTTTTPPSQNSNE